MSEAYSGVRALIGHLQKNNPFYLISAACMLGGCLGVTNSLSWTSIPIARLLALIATLNVYEGALIGLAIYLVHRGILRDGVMLFVLEAFFLVDVTFLNAEVVTSHFVLGLWINVVLFGVAIVKLAVVSRAMGISVWSGHFGAFIVQLGFLFELPIVFRQIDHGSLTAGNFYVAWWAVGILIPVVLGFLNYAPLGQQAVWSRKAFVAYAALPWISIVGHLGILHYVYDVPFYGACAAPVLLGMTLVMAHVGAGAIASRGELRVLQMLLPLGAILVSVNNPAPLCFGMGRAGAIWITPERLALGGAYLTVVYCFAWAHAVYFVGGGAAAVLGFVYGPSAKQVSDATSKLFDGLYRLASMFVPETAAQWGLTAIVAAFAFLGLGARISLRRREIPQVTVAAPEEAGGMGDGSELC